jgi:hypothetical protein
MPMRSFLFSSLHEKFRGADLASFERQHPNDWLLWEPGSWKPPARSTVLMPVGPHAPPKSKVGEGLAFVLSVAPGVEVKLGRDPDNDISINDGTLSSLHLIFRKEPHGGWTVRDSGSRNGTTLTGIKLTVGQAHPLSDGARITAAQVALTFYSPAGMLLRLQK